MDAADMPRTAGDDFFAQEAAALSRTEGKEGTSPGEQRGEHNVARANVALRQGCTSPASCWCKAMLDAQLSPLPTTTRGSAIKRSCTL